MNMIRDPQAAAARNLLLNCAKLTEGSRVLIVVEDASYGHYSPALGPIVAAAAQESGIEAETIVVPFQPIVTHVPDDLHRALQGVDCAIFFARLGDQLRFCGLGTPARIIVSYVLDEDMLASSFGWAHHHAFGDLKHAIDRAVAEANHIRVTCPNGTDFSGPGQPSLLEAETEVAVARFPLSVFAPVPAQGFSGQIAQRGFLTGTCSRFYHPYGVALEDVLLVDFDDNRITGFRGSDGDVATATGHYSAVADQFRIDRDFVHSWHVGIHPGCAYVRDAADNFERWCSGAFGNPRVLHIHTCGAYAPGEISLNVVDPTVEIDGVKVWEHGVLHPERISGGAQVLETYPCARFAFDNPATAIGM